MPYYDIEPSSFSFKNMWPWIFGGIFGAIYHLTTFPMPVILEINAQAVWEYAKVILSAVVIGFATNAGKTLWDVIRERSKRKKEDNKSEPPKIP